MKTRQSTFDHASGSLQFIKMMVNMRCNLAHLTQL
ncbi:unnamed protein product [Rhodiola kirilowii]